MASHELKTPLTSLKLYLELLLKQSHKHQSEKINQLVTRVKGQIEILQELVDGLLDVSRLRTGKFTFKKKSLRLDKLVREAILDLQEAIPQQLKLASPKMIKVQADKFRLYQVLTNLLTNASKYSPHAKQIMIDIKKTNNKATVSIQDFGIGIAKQQQSKVFDRLYQVPDPEAKTFPGLGLGLYIAKEIIKRHQGKIWVKSRPGGGATFSFSLPTA
jgi:hypothetical protein